MGILQGLAVFSQCWCCSKGRKMGRSLLLANFGREVYSPRALSLVPLSSQLPLSLCLSLSTNRNSHPVSCQWHACAAALLCVSCGSAQLGAAAPSLAQPLAFPGCPAAWLCDTLECSANTFLKLPKHPWRWLGDWKGCGVGNLEEEE